MKVEFPGFAFRKIDSSRSFCPDQWCGKAQREKAKSGEWKDQNQTSYKVQILTSSFHDPQEEINGVERKERKHKGRNINSWL